MSESDSKAIASTLPLCTIDAVKRSKGPRAFPGWRKTITGVKRMRDSVHSVHDLRDSLSQSFSTRDKHVHGILNDLILQLDNVKSQLNQGDEHSRTPKVFVNWAVLNDGIAILGKLATSTSIEDDHYFSEKNVLSHKNE